MKIELIPTVASLLQQGALSISGDNQLIEKFAEHISAMTDFVPSFADSLNSECIPRLFQQSQIPELSASIDRPLSKQVLYSIKISAEKLELLAHIHSNSDVVAEDAETKSIFCRTLANLKEADLALAELHDALDSSPMFITCKQCQQLVDAKLCLNDVCHVVNIIAPHQHCETTFKQLFDTSLVDRLSSANSGDGVSVFKDIEADEIKFYVSMTDWPHSHMPVLRNNVIATLPISASYDEVTRLKLKLENEQQYPAPCFHCKEEFNEGEAMDLAYFVDFETNEIVCYGCATEHYNVVY